MTPRPGHGTFDNQGVALIITLLLLFLLSVIGLAAVMSSSSDLMINGYYKNYRGSFYAADSGLNMARESIYTYFQNNSPATWPTAQGTATTDGTTLATGAGPYVTGLYANSYALNTGTAASSVPASFKIITATVTQPSGPSPIGSPVTEWDYIYNYTLESQGTSQGSETAQILEQGTIKVKLTEGSGTTTVNTSFAAFGAYIDSFTACQGPLVQGYDTGPMYAAGQWNLSSGSNPGYTFTDPVSQTGSKFSYYTGNTCTNSSSVPFSNSQGTVAPSFQSGYNLNVTAVTLPPSSMSQEWAVLDGMGCGANEGTTCGSPNGNPTTPTNTQLNAVLKDVTQTAYPTAGASSGVYLPYSCSGSTCSLNSNAGGIYVQGDANVVLSTTGTSGQVFTISQTGSGNTTTTTGTTTENVCTGWGWNQHCSNQQVSTTTTTTSTPTTYTTITVNPSTGTTTVQSYISTASSASTVDQYGNQVGNGSNSTTNSATTTLPLSGVPTDLLTTPAQAATMLYVNGNITSLSGPSSGAAIQNNSMVTVTGNGDITQTGSLLYATEPVTTSANQVISGSSPACCNGDPIDTLIPQNQNMNQVLGIFTANGNFILSPTNSGSNIETDASIAMISQAGDTNSNIGHMATGNSVGAWTVVGGRMENRAAGVSMSSSNTYFDRRFQARTNFAPPWFPATSVSSNMLSNTVTASSTPMPPSRTFWQYQSGQ